MIHLIFLFAFVFWEHVLTEFEWIVYGMILMLDKLNDININMKKEKSK